MKKIICCLVLSIGLLFTLSAQETSEVEAKGAGIKREDALQDALRNAISQAVGVALSSQTKVENFMVISDAIATNTEGYIKSYSVLSEKAITDAYEITVKAVVSLSPAKADFQLLSKNVGGIRFMVMYDDRKVKQEEKADFDYIVDQINMSFAAKKYRYIERNRFESLKKEAVKLMEEDASGTELSYAQQLGLMADAQFIIMIKNIRKEGQSANFDIKTEERVIIDVAAYDNCTAEGLGLINLNGDWVNSNDDNYSLRPGITSAIKNDFDKLLLTFTSYIGDWVNNGTPFELRFYNTGTFRDLRELRNKLKEDKSFGGQLEIVGAANFTKLNCTFRKKADELGDKVLDFADEVPTLKDKKLDVKFIFGRQISFAPQNVTVPGLPVLEQKQESTPVPSLPKVEKKVQSKVPAKKAPVKKTPTKKTK